MGHSVGGGHVERDRDRSTHASPFGSAQSLPPLVSASASVTGSSAADHATRSASSPLASIGADRAVNLSTGGAASEVAGQASLNLRSLRTSNSSTMTSSAAGTVTTSNNWTAGSASTSSSPARGPRPMSFEPNSQHAASAGSSRHHRLPQQQQRPQTAEMFNSVNGGAVPRRNVRKQEEN